MEVFLLCASKWTVFVKTHGGRILKSVLLHVLLLLCNFLSTSQCQCHNLEVFFSTVAARVVMNSFLLVIHTKAQLVENGLSLFNHVINLPDNK